MTVECAFIRPLSAQAPGPKIGTAGPAGIVIVCAATAIGQLALAAFDAGIGGNSLAFRAACLVARHRVRKTKYGDIG